MNWIIFCVFLLFHWIGSVFSSNLDLKGPPFVTSDRNGHQKSVNAGKDGRLNCPISGNPQPIYEWTKGDEAIPEEGWDRFRVQGTHLRIKQVTPEDAAIYICTGVNGFGSVQYAIRMEVLDALGVVHVGDSGKRPKIDEVFPVAGTSITKQLGQGSTFKCKVSGDPQPDVTWFKNGKELHPFDPSIASFPRIQISKFSLLIEDIKASDSANYTCVAMNEYGATTANWTLNVIGSSAVSVSDNEHSLEVRDSTVNEGDRAELFCKGAWDTDIKPKVMWLRQIPSSSIHRYLANETLQYKSKYYHVLEPTYFKVHDGFFVTKYAINDVERVDSGVYVCTATTKFAVNFKQVKLSVLESNSLKSSLLVIAIPSIAVVVIVLSIICIVIRRRRPKSRVTGPSSRSLLPESKMPPQFQPRFIVNPGVPSKNSSHASSGRHSVAPENGRVQYPLNALCSQHIADRNGQPVIIYQDPNSTPSVYVASTASPVPASTADMKYQHLDVV